MTIATTLPQQVLYGTATVTAGTTQTQAGATALTGLVNVVTTGNANDGVLLPSACVGTQLVIVNSSANALRVYPPVGGALNGGTVNVHVTLTASKNALVVYSSELNAATIQAA